MFAVHDTEWHVPRLIAPTKSNSKLPNTPFRLCSSSSGVSWLAFCCFHRLHRRLDGRAPASSVDDGCVLRSAAAWAPGDELAALRAVDAGRGICRRGREALLLAAEHVAAWQEGEANRDVGAAESAGRGGGYEYGAANTRTEVVEGAGRGITGRS